MKLLKTLASLVATTAFLSSIPILGVNISSNAEEPTEILYSDPANGSFYYINHGDYIVITRLLGGNVLCIPEEIDGTAVTVVADGAFSENTIRAMIWPSSVTTIPENAFLNCKKLQNVILPEELECIESNAFEGCSMLCDIFYKGDNAGWDEIRIENENAFLERAYIHVNYNQSDRSDHTFSIEEDSWSFTNNDLVEYLMSEESLTEYLADCHPDTLARYIEYYKAAVAPYEDMMDEYKYKGACSGFALTSYLVSVGVLKPSDIYEGAETLYEIPLCDEAVQAITYYWAFFHHESLSRYQSGSKSDTEYLASGKFREDMEQGKAVVISYLVKQGSHAVVAYGIEDGEWQYNDTTYHTRLLIYDNNGLGFSDKACIYFNGDFEDMYIPYLNSEAGLSDLFFEPDRFPYGIKNRTTYRSTYVLGDENTDGTVDATDAAGILVAAAAAGSGTDSGFNNGQKYASDVNSDGVFNAIDAALVLEYAAYAGAGGEVSLSEYIASL